MIAKPRTGCGSALAAAICVLLFPGPGGAQEAAPRPDMMDPLGRYELRLPDGWGIVGTNSKLNGFVIGNGGESFVAVYHDGEISLDQAIPTMTELCSCSVPEDAEVEILDEAAYPAQLVEIGRDEGGTVVVGTVVFPEGMFGLVSVFKNDGTRGVLKSVLLEARPGPSRSK